jgi:two-component system OmpR family response regulator
VLVRLRTLELDGPPMTPPKNVLVVDHDGDIRQVVADLLLDLGYVVTLAKDAATMRAVLEAEGIDLVVLDVSTSKAEEAALAALARKRGVRLVMISGHPDVMEAFHDRADQLLWKPFAGEALKRAVNHALASGTFGQRREDPD